MKPATCANEETDFHFNYTGLAPVYGICPGVREEGMIHALPQVRLDATRQEILDYFNNGWTMTEVLFSGLVCEEAYFRRPYHLLRHPMIFYYGHVVSVYINKLRVAGLLDAPLNPRFEELFEVGVDEMRWDDLHEGNQQIWPSLAEVCEYRRQGYELICNLIETHPLLEQEHLPITQESPLWALVMGFEHERIHLETSSVLMREMPIEFLRKPGAWPAFHSTNKSVTPAGKMISLAAQEVALGKPKDFPTFGWDNEYGTEMRAVRPFSAGENLVSNGAFLEFVKAGGYREEKYWSREGWGWRCFRNVKWPTFWVQDGPAGSHLFKLRTIFEVIDMPMDWPAVVNFHEAKAYCVWKSERDDAETPYRLLTEAEHNAIRDGREHRYNFGLATGSECPVSAFSANGKGFHDVFGNVWQWCEDHFHPLEGAVPHPYYDDFSAPCYDGEHQMILGGSFISAGDEASCWARFHFRPHFFQHAGFRLARSEGGNPDSGVRLLGNMPGTVNYEAQDMLDKYMLMHWGSDEDIWDEVPKAGLNWPAAEHLPLKCAALAKEYAKENGLALDLGCAVGRAAFEMARRFREVVGVDYSRAFIEKAKSLQDEGALEYWRKDSGTEGKALTARADAAIDRSRIRFEQGDACALPLYLKDFDAVVMSNVLCRLPDPRACLERMQGKNALVKQGGVLVMTTPFSWLEEYTPREKWLNGLDDVAAVLNEFELLHQEEVPFLIRDHRRRFEYVITLASVWRRA